MRILVYSLWWVMQDVYHQPWDSGPGDVFLGVGMVGCVGDLVPQDPVPPKPPNP